jgi:hypothetical protein
MLRSRLLLSAAGVAAASVVAATAATGAPARVFLTVTPHVVLRGNVVHLHGSAGSCPAGDTVFIISHAFVATHRFATIPAVLATARRGGAFDVKTRIPVYRHPGLYHIVVRCGGGNLGINGTVRVLR